MKTAFKFPKILFFLSFLSNFMFCQTLSDSAGIKQTLLDLEKKYMHSYVNKDIKLLKTFWHDEFIGWPEWSKNPLNVEDAKIALDKKSNILITSFKLRPQNVIIKDNIAIIFYFVDLDLLNEQKEKSYATYRIIHTWIKENDHWRILGGMSAK